MSNAVYNKLAFNGFHVTYYNHETRIIENQHFPKYEDVIKRGFTRDGEPFPNAKSFAEDLFNIYGDFVGKVTDNQGNVLLDHFDEMIELYESVNNWP